MIIVPPVQTLVFFLHCFKNYYHSFTILLLITMAQTDILVLYMLNFSVKGLCVLYLVVKIECLELNYQCYNILAKIYKFI